jgi:acyl-CoA reductase-like NAD-dependent aldehyde dehydrogenase
MQKSLKQLLLAASIAAFTTVISTSAFAADAAKAIADAKAAQKQANSVGGEWRDTGKMIKKAEDLLSEGKADEAEALAREAEAQGMLGYMQATGQSEIKDLHI